MSALATNPELYVLRATITNDLGDEELDDKNNTIAYCTPHCSSYEEIKNHVKASQIVLSAYMHMYCELPMFCMLHASLRLSVSKMGVTPYPRWV